MCKKKIPEIFFAKKNPRKKKTKKKSPKYIFIKSKMVPFFIAFLQIFIENLSLGNLKFAFFIKNVKSQAINSKNTKKATLKKVWAFSAIKFQFLATFFCAQNSRAEKKPKKIPEIYIY